MELDKKSMDIALNEKDGHYTLIIQKMQKLRKKCNFSMPKKRVEMEVLEWRTEILWNGS
mgnify:CR=1 FL=1